MPISWKMGEQVLENVINLTTVEGLIDLRRTMIEKRIFMEDIQFLMSNDGDIVLADILSFEKELQIIL